MHGTTLASAPKATGSIRNQAIDFMKLILSVFVVAIHAELDLGILTPILRTAVPLFFLTSGYFFFGKIRACTAKAEEGRVLCNFLKRNLTLYAFWLIALFPVTFYVRDWFQDGFWRGILLFLQDLLFNSTFRASWYLMALNIGMCIILFASRRLSSRALCLCTLPFYLLCCLFSNYMGLVSEQETVMSLYRGYLSVFASLVNSFPASLFWLALANHLVRTKDAGRPKTNVAIALSALGLLLLFAEHALVRFLNLQETNDCYLALVLLCPALFVLVLHAPLTLRRSGRFGEISTIIYVTHASFITVLSPILKLFSEAGTPPFALASFFLALLLCLVVCAVIFACEKFPAFRFLKYAH